MKKHITLILAIIATICMSMFFVACGNSNKDNNPDEETTTISVELNKSALNMVLGTTDNLAAYYDVVDGYALAWSSSDSSIVTVNNGKLEAMKQGVATITATYSNGTESYSDSATVNVVLGGNVPVLCIENRNDASAWNVLTGQIIEFVPYVYFNGMKFYDVEVTVKSSVEGVVSYANNTITALGEGATDLVLEGSWRGISFNGKNAMSVEIPFSVLSNYEMAVNNEAVSDVKLYTRASWGGKTYATSMPFVPTVKEDGELSPNAVDVIIDNEEIVTFNNGVLSQVGFGTTKVTLSWTSSTGDLYTKEITAIVERPVDIFETVIDNFSAADGLALIDPDKDGLHVETGLDKIMYGASGATFVDGFQTYYNYDTKGDVVADPLTIENNNVMGVFSHPYGFQDVELTLGTATEIYIVDVKSASKVFANDNADEFLDTFLTDKYAGVGYTWYKQDGTSNERYEYYWPRVVDGAIKDYRHLGYYTLCEDITCGITINAMKSPKGIFAGVFDGRGFVIDGVTYNGTTNTTYYYRHGIFNSLGSLPSDALMSDKSVQIKNVAFINVNYVNQNCFLLGYQVNGVSGANPEITNVYVQINKQAEYKELCGPLFYQTGYLEMRNVIVDYQVEDTYVLPEYTTTDSHIFGSLIPRMTNVLSNYSAYQASQVLSDIYVISTIPLGHCYVSGKDAKTWLYDGENIDAEGFTKCVEAFRYNTIADMKAANNDYSSFSADMWTIVDGIPVFKALAD